jgi:hypothetical protein
VLADLERAVLELPETTPDNFEKIYDIALRSIASGGDLYLFSTSLMSTGIGGMTGQRAAEISTQLWFRAKEMMDRERHADLGITRARWAYSNAPCMVNPAKPAPADRRRDAAHKDANGKVYVITEGLMLEGKRTWPGRERGCRCIGRSLIPGLDRL